MSAELKFSKHFCSLMCFWGRGEGILKRRAPCTIKNRADKLEWKFMAFMLETSLLYLPQKKKKPQKKSVCPTYSVKTQRNSSFHKYTDGSGFIHILALHCTRITRFNAFNVNNNWDDKATQQNFKTKRKL